MTIITFMVTLNEVKSLIKRQRFFTVFRMTGNVIRLCVQICVTARNGVTWQSHNIRCV